MLRASVLVIHMDDGVADAMYQLNFATEFIAERAIARAKELDEHYQRTGKLVGPLVSPYALQLER